jgi:serine protease Do
VAFAAVAAAALPAHAQQAPDGQRRDDVANVERRTWKLLREKGPSVLSVRVVTRAITLPRLVLPGVTLAPPGGGAECVDASGFVATSDGHVVTTAAALRDAAFVEVRFSDGTVRDAEIVGTDAPFRLAVLRTRAPEKSEPLCVPDRSAVDASSIAWFFQAADGRPDVQLARVRAAEAEATTYDRYLYTTQPLLEGAAGGPLIRSDGRLMGMAVGEVRRRADTADGEPRVSQATLFVRGDDIHGAVRDIIRYGKIQRPMLGVVMDRDTNRIDQLLPGGPAARAGLREGDCVVGIAGTEVGSLADVTRHLLRRAVGETVLLDIERDGESVERVVELAAMDLPALPRLPPFPGASLQLSAEADAHGGRDVSFTDVRVGSSLHAAGVRAGDRLISVDGRDAMRFLARHRIHAADALPHVMSIERGDERHVIVLGR